MRLVISREILKIIVFQLVALLVALASFILSYNSYPWSQD